MSDSSSRERQTEPPCTVYSVQCVWEFGQLSSLPLAPSHSLSRVSPVARRRLDAPSDVDQRSPASTRVSRGPVRDVRNRWHKTALSVLRDEFIVPLLKLTDRIVDPCLFMYKDQ